MERRKSRTHCEFETGIRNKNHHFSEKEKRSLEQTCQTLQKCWEEEQRGFGRQKKELMDKLQQLQHENALNHQHDHPHHASASSGSEERGKRDTKREGRERRDSLRRNSQSEKKTHNGKKIKGNPDAPPGPHQPMTAHDVATRLIAPKRKKLPPRRRHTIHFDTSSADANSTSQWLRFPDIKQYRSGRIKDALKGGKRPPEMKWDLTDDKISSKSVPEVVISQCALSKKSQGPNGASKQRSVEKAAASSSKSQHLPSVPIGKRSSLLEMNCKQTDDEKTDSARRHTLHIPTSSSTLQSRSSRNTWTAQGDKAMTAEDVEHFFSVLANSESALRRKDRHFTLPSDHHGPLSAMRFGSRRQQLVFQTILNQLPSFRKKIPFDPEAILQCRYLRLTKDNIEELEQHCRDMGRDPGIHAHMTEEQVLQFFENLDQDQQQSESEEELHIDDL